VRVGGNHVVFRLDEVRQLTTFGDEARGITIVGFQPRALLRDTDNLGPSILV
jgi:hypothetical protein